MTKKDYVLIAAAIHRDCPNEQGMTYAQMTDWQKGASDEWHTMTLAIAAALGNTNPRFDRAKFLAACGVQS